MFRLLRLLCIALSLSVWLFPVLGQETSTNQRAVRQKNVHELMGVVKEPSGEPLPGATVYLKGNAQIGTATDLNGNFVLKGLPSGKQTIVVSCIGMETKEFAYTGQKSMKIILQEKVTEVQDVVVTGIYVRKKNSFTGSATTYSKDDLKRIGTKNIIQSLKTLEPALNVIENTSWGSDPNRMPDMEIRGKTSIVGELSSDYDNTANQPLFILDGVEVTIEDIMKLPIDRIASVTVLKDAASTSLYGSSAGNGVVLITTKKGSTSSGAGVTLSISQGWSSRAYNDYAKVGVYDYYPLQWQMLRNANMSLGQSAADAAANASKDIINKLKYNPFVGIANDAIVGTDGLLNPSASALKWGEDLDWEDAAYRTGHRQEYNVSYNTKTEKSDTYASIGYLNDKGYMIKTDFERYNARLNYNIYPVKWFKSGLNLGLSRTNSNYSTSTSSNSAGYGNLSRFIRSMAPIYPVHKHDIETGAYLDKEGNVVTDPALYTYDYEGAMDATVSLRPCGTIA